MSTFSKVSSEIFGLTEPDKFLPPNRSINLPLMHESKSINYITLHSIYK